MITLKFGGTSMGSAKRILASAKIIKERFQNNGRLSVVVSAVATVSNSLQEMIDKAVASQSVVSLVNSVENLHYNICDDLDALLIEDAASGTARPFHSDEVKSKLAPYFSELRKLLDAVGAFNECPSTIYCKVMGLGELLSSVIMERVLTVLSLKTLWLDSRNFIYTTGDEAEGVADYTRCAVAFKSYQDGLMHDDAEVLLFPGFICTWRSEIHKDKSGLLGRNGSDYSAAIVAWGLNASRVEFWTDVDGVYTSDPRIVKDAVIINNMSYNEAMELSFFGSKVLHPRTLAPLVEKGIEAWSLNSKNTQSHGTRISAGDFTSERSSVLCGVSALQHVAMITVSGVALRGTRGAAARIFTTVGAAGGSMLLITQSSSEYTISFCVKENIAPAVTSALEKEFALEIKEQVIDPPTVKNNCAIISIVGDGMVRHNGVAAKFMAALSHRAINIFAIAQGSSERNISCVIDNDSARDAVEVTHSYFFSTKKHVTVFCFGAGTIGGELLRQISATNHSDIDIKVVAITTIDGMLFSHEGIDLTNWAALMKNGASNNNNSAAAGTFDNQASNIKWTPFGDDNVDSVIEFVKKEHPEHPIFIDCTASDLPRRYVELLENGVSIITPNKRANTLDMAFYKKLREVARTHGSKFLYETNVGAGLPIIEPLQKLLKAGDRIQKFVAIPSGSLSYIFGKLDENVPFSQAVLSARNLRYTEPDPREDLAGRDAARKALIIARECGSSIEMSDANLTDCFEYVVKNGGPAIDMSGTWEEFAERLPSLDEWFSKKVDSLKAAGKVIRMGVEITYKGTNLAIKTGVMEVGSDSPLYTVRNGNNVFVFYTNYYSPEPLVIQGYGAGAPCTAAGVYSDLLRVLE